MKTKTKAPVKKAGRKTATKSSRPSRIGKSSKESLENIFVDMLKDMYWAENHLSKALPKMAKAAYSEELKEAFERHLQETQNQVLRLEKCFSLLDQKPQGKKCPAMQGLLEEGQEVIDDHTAGHVRDAALIGAAQKIEHYEISSYGTLRTMATVLGKIQCAELMEANKDEEAETDEKLTRLAEKINTLAIAGNENE